MKNQFATYEIALKLKELGFDEKCFGVYYDYKGNYKLCFDSLFSNKDIIIHTDEHSYCALCLAPLWQQVVDWIYSNYNILIYQYVNPDDIMFWVVKSKVQDFYSKKEYAFLKAIELCQKER